MQHSTGVFVFYSTYLCSHSKYLRCNWVLFSTLLYKQLGTLETPEYDFFWNSDTCFPSMATVEMENGESVTMSDQKIGNKEKTGSTQYFIN